jgi:hypothetical protein
MKAEGKLLDPDGGLSRPAPTRHLQLPDAEARRESPRLRRLRSSSHSSAMSVSTGKCSRLSN